MLKDRILTRVTQAIGRCTRSATDYAAVVILEEDLNKYLLQLENRRYMHPELQAEIAFGIDQSKDGAVDTFSDNFRIFLEHAAEWDAVDAEIVEMRADMTQATLPTAGQLSLSAPHEIAYQERIWNGNHDAALESARLVLGHLNGNDLTGYRAFWDYLAGNAALLAGRSAIAEDFYGRAAVIAPGVRWMKGLSKAAVEQQKADPYADAFEAVIEGLEAEIELIGSVTATKFEGQVKAITEGLGQNSAKAFETAHEALGQLLGYSAGLSTDNAAPDPWWCAGDEFCVVFEDHTNIEPAATTEPIGANKVRQAASHPNWIKKNVPLSSKAEITPVMISPCRTVSSGADPHVDHVCYWNTEEFRKWADDALAVVRKLWNTFPGPGDLAWRAEVKATYTKAGLDPASLVKMLKACMLSQLPVIASSKKGSGATPV